MIDTAMILAAGKGTRMRAAPNDPPKPLTELAGESLLARMVARLATAGITHIVVNVHHKAAAIEAALAALAAAYPHVCFDISDERDTLLETGGGVKKALPLLGPKPFLVANADVVWQENRPIVADFIRAFEAAYQPDSGQAQLLLARCDAASGYDGRGDYHLGATGTLRRAGADGADYLFAGVQILDPGLFAESPAGAFSLNAIYDKAEAMGTLCGHVLDGRWMHVGTPEGRAAAEAILSR